jgi:release factor glutamine methyltransferase
MSPVTAASSIHDALAASVDALTAAGVEQPRLDAELLLAEASGLDRAGLAADPTGPVSPGAARAFGAMVRRRVRREPLAYILGWKGFRRIELKVDRRVLIPRPETELLVEMSLELRPRKVLDVGTGSGAVALAIADELPQAEVSATDTDQQALELAQANAEALELSGRVRFLPGTIPEGERFDLVLANLPYVSETEWEKLMPEIREWEPKQALVSGPTGLEALEELIAAVAREGTLEAGGTLALEIGAGESEPVRELLAAGGFESVETRADLAGIERVAAGRR